MSQHDSKQAEKRNLDEAYADEFIKILPEALQSSEGLEKFFQIFSKLGKLDSKEREQAERIYEKVGNELFAEVSEKNNFNEEDDWSAFLRLEFLKKMLRAHDNCGVKEVHTAVATIGFLPLACLRDYLKLMIKHYGIGDGIDRGANNFTLLHSAVYVGNVDAVTALLELNVTVNAETTRGETALDFAKDMGYQAMHNYSAAVDEAGRAEILARIKGYQTIMQLLRTYGAKTGEELAAEKAEAKAQTQTQTPSAVAGSISKLMGEVTASEQGKTAEKENVNKAAGMPTSTPEGQEAADPDPTPPSAATK